MTLVVESGTEDRSEGEYDEDDGPKCRSGDEDESGDDQEDEDEDERMGDPNEEADDAEADDDEEDEEEDDERDATQTYQYFDSSHKVLSRMVSQSVIDEWVNELKDLGPARRHMLASRCWIALVLERGEDVPGFRPPRYSKGNKRIASNGIGRWVAHHDSPTWKAAFKSMRIKLNFNDDYGTPAQRTEVRNYVQTSSWRQAGMPSADFHNPIGIGRPCIITNEERLAWICLLDAGAVVFEPR